MIDSDHWIIKDSKLHNLNSYNLSKLVGNSKYLFKLEAKLGIIRHNL